MDYSRIAVKSVETAIDAAYGAVVVRGACGPTMISRGAYGIFVPGIKAERVKELQNAKCKLKKAKYKTGMKIDSFDFKAPLNAIC